MTPVWLGLGFWLLGVVVWRLALSSAECDQLTQLPQSADDNAPASERAGLPAPGAADNTP